MPNQKDSLPAIYQHREQMLKLIARSFYKEMVNYGVSTNEVLTVTEYLLDSLQNKGNKTNGSAESDRGFFSIKNICDEWDQKNRLTMQEVGIAAIDTALIPKITDWLKAPKIRESFYPAFPESEEELEQYFRAPHRDYFAILYQQTPVGMIGAENIDPHSSKLEMRKLIGDPGMYGKGIGTRATFLFLYYVFVIRKFRKVYIHSIDINIHNININARFGFELEGVLLEDFKVQEEWRDVVRMSLSRSLWMNLFS
jgi:RimJ/RimL family protein N-acetyltransferase